MPLNQTQRPKFYEEQYLGAADLTAAVEYGRVQQARHTLGAHTWGIAIGLQLKETPQPNGAVSVHLLPGYAWDGYGRPIVVLSPYKIPEEKFSAITFDAAIDTGDGEKGRLIPVWLRYDESATQNPRPGFEVCETADQRSRIQETFRIEIGQPGTTGRYTGITVAAKSLKDAKTALQEFDPTAPLVYDESIPQQAFPEPQDRARWLIPIGYVRWLPVQTPPGHFVARDDKGLGGAEKDFDKIRRFRRYIGIVAEEIEAADGVIRLRDRGRDPMSSFFQAPTKKQPTDATYDLANDLVWVEGNLRVIGNAKLCNGKLDFRDQEGKDSNIPLTIQRKEDAGAGARALQVAIGPDTQNNHRFAVGPLQDVGSDNEHVVERFVVLSGGNVGIGTSAPKLNLEIQGKDFGRDDGPATLHLFGARIGDTGGTTLFLKAFGGGVVAFNGDNNRVGVGTDTPVSKLEINGDLALQKLASGVARALPAGATMCWNDGTWLRLNENLDFSQPVSGVRTGGVLAPDSLNVRGAGNFGNPGPGNVWVTGRVGIGTTTPQASLQVTDGAIMPAVGNNQTAGIQFPSNPGSGGLDEAFIRYFVAVPGTETTKLLIGINDNADDTLGFHQAGAERMIIRSGNVGIGTPNPTSLLDVAGQINVVSAFSTTGWTSGSSDERLKKDIVPLTGTLNKLFQLRGIQFYWKEPEKMGHLNGPQIGLVAQEVEKVFPEWVTVGPNGYKALTFRGFEALTIEALRELRGEMEALRTRLEAAVGKQPVTSTRPRRNRG